MQLGSTAIGIQTSQGVVLACEKRLTSTLMEPNSMEKIMKVDSHIGTCHFLKFLIFDWFFYLGCTTSGLIGDSKTLVDRARVESQVSS